MIEQKTRLGLLILGLTVMLSLRVTATAAGD